jgi:hypothetical protein
MSWSYLARTIGRDAADATPEHCTGPVPLCGALVWERSPGAQIGNYAYWSAAHASDRGALTGRVPDRGSRAICRYGRK